MPNLLKMEKKDDMNSILFKYNKHGNTGLRIHKGILSVAVIFILAASALSMADSGATPAASQSVHAFSQRIVSDIGKLPIPQTPSPSQLKAQFNETGLPTGTEWSVNISGTAYSSTGQSIMVLLAPGSYSYIVRNPIGFYNPSPQGHLTVTNQDVKIQVDFHGKLSIAGYVNLYSMQFDSNSSALSTNQSVFPVYGLFDAYSHNYIVVGYQNSEVYLIDQHDFSKIAGFRGPASPVSVDYNHNNGDIYVINSTTVFIYNETGSLIASSYLGSYLVTVAFNPINGQVMVGNLYGGLYFLNGTTLAVMEEINSITVLDSQSIAYNSALNQMEVINDSAQNGNIVFLNGADKPVSQVNATGTLISLIYNPSSSSTYYVGLQSSLSRAYVLNSTGTHLIPGTENSFGLGLSQSLNSVLVTNTQNGTVQLINSSTNDPIYTIQGAGAPLIPLSAPGNSTFLVVNPMEDALDTVSYNSVVVKVNFLENGLPSTTRWNVTINGQQESSTTNVVTFYEIPGTYGYSVGSVPGYVTPVPGQFTARGPETNVSLSFIKTYSVTFSEQGLPSGMFWAANLSGSTVSGPWNTSIHFSLPNGTYFFSIPSSGVYTASPDSGFITVNGTTESVSLNFATSTYTLSFISSGLPPGHGLNIFINGIDEKSNGTSLNYSAIPGSYSYYIPAINGYYPEAASGTAIVSDSNVTVTVKWLPYLFRVNFTETGLPTGSPWEMHIGNNLAMNSTSSDMSANLQNGTYSYTFVSLNSSWKGGSGIITVNGGVLQVSLQFTPVMYKVTFTERGLEAGSYWSVMVQGAGSSGTHANSTQLSLQNGTYTFLAESSNTSFSTLNGHFTVNGSDMAVNLSFSLKVYNIKFTESGLQEGTLWGIYIPGSGNHTGDGASLNVTLPVGEHSYAPLPVPGYNSSSGGLVNVVSGNLTVHVNYTLIPHSRALYNITFFELGLPEGFHWSVTLNNTTKVALPDGFFAFQLPNGTYNLSIESIGPHGKIFSMQYELELIVFGTNQYVYVLFYGPYPWLIIDFAVPTHGGFSSTVNHHHESGFSVARDIVAATKN